MAGWKAATLHLWGQVWARQSWKMKRAGAAYHCLNERPRSISRPPKRRVRSPPVMFIETPEHTAAFGMSSRLHKRRHLARVADYTCHAIQLAASIRSRHSGTSWSRPAGKADRPHLGRENRALNDRQGAKAVVRAHLHSSTISAPGPVSRIDHGHPKPDPHQHHDHIDRIALPETREG